ncbi:MAG: hypothetical protein ACD_52C00091G0002 [uncultured bacterium]|nr:MAG: hypothetical protein ACD_52C00091G0002 [uncultured bacterium]
MKYFFSQAKSDYSNYLFPYQVYLIKEESDNAEEIYNKGFLPVRSIRDLYYLSRSCRVDLTKFMLSSENRRVSKSTDDLYFEIKNIDKFDFRAEGIQLATKFVKAKYGKSVLTREALKKLFSNLGNYNKVATFRSKSSLVGFVALYVSDDIVHYAHPFYDLDTQKKSLGLGLVVATVDWAKNSKRKFAYLGTVYGINSLYKTQFAGFEFYDGVGWQSDLDELKAIIAKDTQAFEGHLLQDKSFLSKYHAVVSLTRLVKKLKYAVY